MHMSMYSMIIQVQYSQDMMQLDIIYQVVRKVRATHILLNCGKIIIAFIECTDLRAATTRCQPSCKFCRSLQKNSELRSVK